MTEHKFTDEEVIKALEVCVQNDSCKECPINPNHGNYGYCTNLALTYALDLIKRQKAEIERLDTIVNPKEHGVSFFMMINEAKERTKAHNRQLKAEAVKEFADRLKERLIVGGIYPAFVKNSIEKLLKEMTEEK